MFGRDVPGRQAGAGWFQADLRPYLGIGAVLAAAALWGSTGTVAHFAPAGTTPASVGAARIVIGGALLVLIALRGGRGSAAAGRSGFWHTDAGWSATRRAALAIGAIGVAGYQVCFFTAVRLTGVAVGTVIAIGSGPVLAGLISWLAGTARPSARWAVATAGAIAGCAVLLAGGQRAGVNVAGAGLALLAGLCYACYAVCAATLIRGGTAERPVMAVMFGGAAVLLAPVLAGTQAGWLLTWRGAAVAGWLGVLATAVAYLLYGYGLRTVQVPAAVTLGLAEPVIAAVLGVAVLGERLTGHAIAGLGLVGCSLVLLVAAHARRGSPGRPGAASPPGEGAGKSRL